MPQAPLQILVIGGGLGGLCLAQGLHKAGIKVGLYERDTLPMSRDQGYRTHIDIRGKQALQECLPANLYELFLATCGQESKGLTVFSVVDGQLKEIMTRHFSEKNESESVSIGSAVDRLNLRQILLAGLDDVVHFGKEFIRYEQLDNGTICAYFADGTSAIGDVLIAADGVGSRIRQQFLPHAEVIDTGTRWLGGKTILTDEIRALLPTQLDETFASVPGDGQSMVFGLVMFRQDPNQAATHLRQELQFYNTTDYVFWGIIAQQHLFSLSDDEIAAMSGSDLQHLALGLSINRPQTLRTLIEQCKPDQTFVLKMRYAQPITHWQTNSITLLGDAIHVMPPNGSGANNALFDASLLSRSLIAIAQQHISLHQALHDYEIEMLRYGFNAIRAFLPGGRPGTPFASTS